MSDLEHHFDDSVVAIIGMACKFPGADTPGKFWDNLRHGKEGISFFNDNEVEPSGLEPAELDDPNYVKAAPILDDVELFDAGFFNITPNEARVMDPQQRLFLQCAWAALEDAGYTPENYKRAVGVFGGARTSSYLFNIFSNGEIGRSVGAFEVGLGNDAAFLTSRVSYKLNLTGPSYSVHTACSTSLVAVHLACNSLLIDECQMALAGGVAVNVPHRTGYLYRKGGILSRDGHCRAFDAGAQGTIFGSGVGIVVLKRLADAIRDKDNIYALIKGTATNNDGWAKASFTAPGVHGQSSVLLDALACGGVDADSIGFVEAHATGTLIGDPIEVQALTRAYRTQTRRRGYCALGSVKSNVGHLDAAAGVAGLIKAVLALKHREIPPTLHFRKANPEMMLEESPFYVNSELKEWKSNGHPRRAGVSAFGVGGTNAHVVLEEAPEQRRESGRGKRQLLPVSARSRPALERATEKLVEHLKRHPGLELGDVAYTLQVGRKSFAHRRFVVCESVGEVVETLERRESGKVFTGEQERQGRPVVFLFPGQGSQYAGMGRGLYEEGGMFREEMDRCAEILQEEMKIDIREVVFGGRGEELEETRLVQPGLFAVEYALARTWMSWGVEPEAMMGHSLGEYVAACVAGVFSVEEGLRLVARRGRMMQEMEGGAMIAVGVEESEAQGLAAGGELSVAAVNGPQQCVLSGRKEAVEEMERRLAGEGITWRRLKTSHAFHSGMMDPMLKEYGEEVKKVRMREPERRYVSNVTGNWIGKEEARSAEYWVQHVRQGVRFGEGVKELLADPQRIFLEVGPGQALVRLVKANSAKMHAAVTVHSMPSTAQEDLEAECLLRGVGNIWLSGGSPEWEKLHAQEDYHRVPLPTYPFEGERFWIDPVPEAQARSQASFSGKNPKVEDWFYLPSWRRTVLTQERHSSLSEQWIIFSDFSDLASSLRHALEAEDRKVAAVRIGAAFQQSPEHEFIIDPAEQEHYARLLKALPSAETYKIVHLWSLTPEGSALSGAERFKSLQVYGYYSLLSMSKALKEASAEIEVLVVSDRLNRIEGRDAPYPEKQTMFAVCQVVPQEAPNIRFRSLELDPAWHTGPIQKQVSTILDEAKSASRETVLAYRGDRRLARSFDPVKLDVNSKVVRKLRHKGVYVITGGFGGVGVSIAEHLARTFSAKLVLISRTAIPNRSLWPEYLEHNPNDAVGNRIRQMQELEGLGSEVMAISLDLTNVVQVKSAFDEIEQSFGEINGVFHTAGVTTGDTLFRSFAELGATESEIQFGPKVYGVYVLQQAFENRNPDFCLLFSSNAAILGGLGYLTYVAANLFMDALSQNSGNQTAWISANWDPWPKEIKRFKEMKTSVDQYAMTVEESLEALMKVIEHVPSGQVVVATGDLEKRLNIWIHDAGSGTPQSGSMRPELAIEYVPPSGELENAIAVIWQRILGMERIGRNDNFFDLGGHSLLATRLISQMRDEFQCEIPINKFFEAPTIGETANLIQAANAGQEDDDRSAILAMLAELSDEEVEMELKKRA
jgi:phthiocerol/phenolphthiocerol synthesis type-I polyketide synthase E